MNFVVYSPLVSHTAWAMPGILLPCWEVVGDMSAPVPTNNTLFNSLRISCLRINEQTTAAEQPQIRLMISDNLIGILSQVLLAKKSGGLIDAFELLTMTPAVRNLIREQKVTQILNVIQTNRQIGMCTMEDSMLNLVERNVVSPSEAMARAFRPQELLQMMRESPKVPLSEIAGLK